MTIQSVQTRTRVRQKLRPRTARAEEIPPLEPGDRLSRPEFERRYEAHPEITKAELIEGVVYMPTLICHQEHGQPHSWIVTWLGTYVAATPNVDIGDNTTVRLDLENEVQPDALLRLEPAVGGQSHITEDDYLEGPPELIVEIAASSASYDMHVKRRVYARSGVQEYLAVQMYEEHIDWFALHEGVYEKLSPDEKGILHSEVFPGLRLDPGAFWHGELRAMLNVLQEGLDSPEHAELVSRLQEEEGEA